MFLVWRERERERNKTNRSKAYKLYHHTNSIPIEGYINMLTSILQMDMYILLYILIRYAFFAPFINRLYG